MPAVAVTPDALGPRERTLHSSPSSDVYVATQTSSGIQVVVKRTKITGPNDMKRFDKELEFLLACDHASIIAPLGVLRVPPTYALVLSVFERGSLFGALHASAGRVVSDRAKVSTCLDLASAIEHLHAQGILHRDIKSDNVLLRADGRAVLADFNAAEWESKITADIVMHSRPTGGFFKQFVVGTLPCASILALEHAETHVCMHLLTQDVRSLSLSMCAPPSQIWPLNCSVRCAGRRTPELVTCTRWRSQ